MAQRASPPQPEDWQALAAVHCQQQLARKVSRLDKQARRGNHIVGGCLMVSGILAFIVGLLTAGLVIAGRLEIAPDVVRGIYGCLAAGVVTVGIGWAIWRHRTPRPPPDPITGKVDTVLDAVDVASKLRG